MQCKIHYMLVLVYSSWRSIIESNVELTKNVGTWDWKEAETKSEEMKGSV
jgi:hypothetical protein